MRLVQFALKNPYFIFVCVVAVITIGLISFFRIPRDLLPLFKTPAVQVLTLYPGMPAEVVEKDITSRIERWTGQANGMARQESRSMIGVSIVKDYFRPDIDPNTAMSQVTSLAMSDLYYLPPGTIPPMIMPFDPTATVPLVLLAVSGSDFGEKELYDIAYFELRNRLQGISGVIAPAVYGGKLRRILAYVDPEKLASYNLSPLDVANTMKDFNTLIPTGNVKLGDIDYQIVTNGMVEDVAEMNQFPIRSDFTGREVLIGDVAKVEDTAQIQSNIVRVNGRRQVYIPVYRQPGANTISVVNAIQRSIKGILERLPKGISIHLVADQSKYVRQALNNLTWEACVGGLLAVLMIWLFLGHLQTALAAAIAIPLSILATFIGFLWTGDSLNAMTLGGLALAIGRLVDDSIVVTENTVRHRMEGMGIEESSLKGAGDVTLPVLAATLTTVIVFVPVFFLSGISQFLFAPLARSVTFSIAASFLVAMLVIPILMKWIKVNHSEKSTWFQDRFERFRHGYAKILPYVLERRRIVFVIALVLFAFTFILYPFVGKELFPAQDVGHLSLKVRMQSGTRIEKTEKRMAAIEEALKEVIPEAEIQTVVSNIGVLYDWPAAYTPNAGPSDAFMEIQLTADRSESSQAYGTRLRNLFQERYPDMELVVDTGSILTAALTFGLPAPIDIQINGNDYHVSQQIAEKVIAAVSDIEGLVDVRIQQRLDYPQLSIEVDRRKAAALGLNTVDVVKNVVSATNSSVTFDPAFWIDPDNGNHYFAGAQYRESDLIDIETLKEIPITSPLQNRSVPLKEIASFGKKQAPAEINHINISRVMDIYGNVEGRDLGAVSADIEKRLAELEIPPGYQVELFGEMSGLKDSFENLSYGLLLATFLVYLVLVAQFRSFKDPLIILVAVPLGLIGVIGALWLTGSRLNIQSFLGTIFMVGIVVSNSILIVEFANRRRIGGKSLKEAIISACSIRLRPILMTSFAAIFGLLPMAIGFGHGAEANVPLARAVIGGLFVSTFLSLFVVPCVYYSFHLRTFGQSKQLLSTVLLFICLNLPATSIRAEESATSISLDRALQYAEKHHPLLKAAATQTKQGTWAVRKAYSGYLPKIQGGIVETSGMNGSYAGLGFRGLNNSAFKSGYGVDVELEQTLFDFGRTQNRIRAAKSQRDALRVGEVLVEADLLFQVHQAYYQCQYYRALHRVYVSAEGEAGEMADEISRYVKTGQRTPIDESLVQVTVIELAEQKVSAQNDLELSIDQLNLVMGTDDGSRYACQAMGKSRSPSKRASAQSVMALTETALAQRPEVAQMTAAREQAEYDRKAARSAFLPEIVGVASVGDLQDTDLLDEKHYAVGVGLRVPIFNQMTTIADYKNANLEKERLSSEADYLKRQVQTEVQQSIRDSQKNQKLVSLAAKRRRGAKQAFDLAKERYLKKAGYFADLDQAHEAWLESEANYWRRRYDHLLSDARLTWVIGEMGAAEN